MSILIGVAALTTAVALVTLYATTRAVRKYRDEALASIREHFEEAEGRIDSEHLNVLNSIKAYADKVLEERVADKGAEFVATSLKVKAPPKTLTDRVNEASARVMGYARRAALVKETALFYSVEMESITPEEVLVSVEVKRPDGKYLDESATFTHKGEELAQHRAAMWALSTAEAFLEIDPKA